MENIIGNRPAHYQTLFAGVAFFALTLPLSKSISSIAIGLTYAYCLVVIAFDKDFRATVVQHIKQPLNVTIILFILIILFRSLFSQNIANGLNFVKQVSNLFTIYLAVSVLVDIEQDEAKRRRKSEILLLFFIAGIFMLDIMGLLTYAGVIGNIKHVLPLTPLKMHHIWAGNLNATGLYAAAALLMFSPYCRRLAESAFLWCFIGVGAVSVLLSTARTAWFGMILTSLVLVFFLIRSKKILVITGMSLILACVAAYSFTDIIHQRIDLIFRDVSLFSSGVTNTSIGARFLMWQAAMTLFLSHPFFGVGIGDYNTALAELVASGALPPFIQKFNQPHNMYLFALATNGLVGFFALLFIFYRIFQYAKGLISLHQKDRLYWVLAIAVAVHFITAGLTESLFSIHILISSFALVMGVSVRRSNLVEGKA